MYPVIYDFGPIAIYSYGLMLGVAFILGIFLSMHLGARIGISAEHILNLGIIILISSIIGARLFYIGENYTTFLDDPAEILKFWSGGFVFYGGFLVAISLAVLYCRRSGISFLAVADAMSPGIALGLAIARVGCFLGGCCYGKSTTFFLGVQFPDDSPAAFAHGIEHHIHPAQLYGTVAGLILFMILLILFRWRKFNGQVFWTLLVLYPVARFILELFRVHTGRAMVFGMTISQFLSLFLFLFGILGYLVTRKSEGVKHSTGSSEVVTDKKM
jgi:phosphatidylglycerol:prolipoprotein diacylglycerol transferase